MRNRKFPVWLKIILGIIILLAILVVVFVLWWKIKSLKDSETEKKIDIKFHQEVAKIPEMKIDSFVLWEGSSIVQVEIEKKGKVLFWYNQDGVISIDGIGDYPVSHDCFYINSDGAIKGYAGDVSLQLGKDSPYKKWFPFEVNSLRDLVNKYDEIVKILATFPKNPEMTTFHDRWWGDRQVVKNPNPEFVVHQKIDNKDATCDLFQ